MILIFTFIYLLSCSQFLIPIRVPIISIPRYHHVTVHLYSYWLYSLPASSGLWFQAMNCIVHSIMYPYYLLSELGVNLRPIAVYITSLQLIQMFGGLFITGRGIYLGLFAPELPCATVFSAHVVGFLMYLSYAVLFAMFFFERYSKPKTAGAAKGKAKKQE
jgi:elongation of very long chain fatty acids protein 6